MLGELVAREAGQAVVQDICSRAQQNGRDLLSQPADKLTHTLMVGHCLDKHMIASIVYCLIGFATVACICVLITCAAPWAGEMLLRWQQQLKPSLAWVV
jgi:hypothetical protein